MHSISPTAQSILTFLNNINDLIVVSSNRSDAKKAMKALVLYAENKKFNLPEDKIQNFFEILLDSRPYTLTNLVMDIAEDVFKQGQSKNKSKKSIEQTE